MKVETSKVVQTGLIMGTSTTVNNCAITTLIRSQEIALLLLFSFVLFTCKSCAQVSFSGNPRSAVYKSQSITEGEIRDKALEKLMQVFQFRPPNHRVRHRGPPQYMLDLYNSVTHSSGVTTTSNPYDANIVRSFPDRDHLHHTHFYFNLSGVDAEEKVLQAEFHVCKTNPTPKTSILSKPRLDDAKSHLLEMRVYQVMDEIQINKEDGNRLLDARRVSSYSVGWEVFHVKAAVADWLKNHSSNHGLLVTFRTMAGEPISVDDISIQIVKRKHHGHKQPILVLFTDDGRQRHPTTFPTAEDLVKWNLNHEELDQAQYSRKANTFQENSTSNNLKVGEPEMTSDAITHPISTNSDDDIVNQIRASELYTTMTEDNMYNSKHSNDCKRYTSYIDFEKIGWTSWIVLPRSFNAYYCLGECSFSSSLNHLSTNHAMVQSIIHELHMNDNTKKPCCVPNKLYSISLLYFDNNGNVILKRYEEMVAANCACH